MLTLLWRCLLQINKYFDGDVSENLKENPSFSSKPQPPVTDRLFKLFDYNAIPWHQHADYYKFSECRYSRCEFTTNSLKADLLMVNAARLKQKPLPPRRRDALLLMYTKEPPTFKKFRFLNRTELMGSVNWSRCIYADSTFRAHYYNIIKRDPPVDKDYNAIFNRKRHQVAWFVSHCATQSRREEYVRRMSSEIDVDIFGGCGTKTCGDYGFEMGGQRDMCLDILRNDYKFYLSFENSMCSDYVSEKFYNMYDNVDIIPVVRGGANYSEFVSKDTFVNAADFASPEELGRYLRRLGQDKTRYIQMLQKKDCYISVPPREKFHCTLCEALHTRGHIHSVYRDFYKWLMGHCWEPTDL
ncbi:glycoprotein 3-alpha-l-fucosyltransferase a [Plakobranchus ocellatus]|uniref:Fucosyltransferase n=1 Tax=Plakobranchus ocellatus TaxID=259542 RepID=A0AAV4AV97_9GAST|nr:glycoprotein 3-alpha-l-fucosyltransferase a [Plakobranchus ocellatus]